MSAAEVEALKANLRKRLPRRLPTPSKAGSCEAFAVANVCFWHLADMLASFRDVCFRR